MTHLGAAASTGDLTILRTLLEYTSFYLDRQNKNSLHLDISSNKRRNIGYFVVCRDVEENEFGEGPTPDGMEALEWDTEMTEANVTEDPPEDNLYEWYARILKETAFMLQSPENDISRFDHLGQTILHHAVQSGNIEMVQYLVENFSDINVYQVDSNGFTPLHKACMCGSFVMAKYLISRNANVNAVKHLDRQTPLHEAARYGHTDIVCLLIDSGANVNAFDIHERSPLSYAITGSHEDIAKILIQKGTSLNREEFDGCTVLYHSVVMKLPSVTKVLLEYGAKITQSLYLLHLAIDKRSLELVKILHEAGAVLNFRDSCGYTPLMSACIAQDFAITEYLLKNGKLVLFLFKSLQ